jgi:hypothetical protein
VKHDLVTVLLLVMFASACVDVPTTNVETQSAVCLDCRPHGPGDPPAPRSQTIAGSHQYAATNYPGVAYSEEPVQCQISDGNNVCTIHLYLDVADIVIEYKCTQYQSEDGDPPRCVGVS